MHRNRARFTFSLLCAAALVAVSLFAPQLRASEADKIRLCFVSGSNPDHTVMQWYPMITYLTDSVGRPFEIMVRDSYEDLLEDYRNGKIDLVMSGPFNYVTTKRSSGATLVAAAQRRGEKLFHGVIAVREESPFKSLADLKGGSFAFTEPYSTTGYLLPRIAMADAGIPQPADFFREVVFAGHHTEARDSLISKDVDAAAFVSYLIPDLETGSGSALRVIAMTPTLPPEVLLAHPSFDRSTVERIRASLLSMHERVSPEVMKRLGIARFTEIGDSDFDAIRESEAKLADLPPLPYTIDYGRMPAEISRAGEKAWAYGLKAIMAAPALAILVTILLLAFARGKIRRDLRLKFAATLFAAISLMSIIVAGLSAAGLGDRIGNITLAWQRSINVFTALASGAAGSGNDSMMGPLAESLAAQRGISYVKIFRNGFYVADSEHKEEGLSIMPKVISGTFRPSEQQGGRLIDAAAYIMAGDRRYGAAQIGIDTTSLHEAVERAVAGNIMAILLLLASGAAISILWSRRVTKPIEQLHLAVADIRAGRRPNLDAEGGEDQIAKLARCFREMGAELAQTGELIKLKEQELGAANRKLDEYAASEARLEDAIDEIDDCSGAGDAAMEAIKVEIESMAQSSSLREEEIDALRNKIADIEKELPALAVMRSREIIGTAPAFLRVIRDIIIRARDSDPVLLHGESGSGKTGVARAIHELSPRCGRPIVEYNCAEFAAADPAIVLGKLFGFGKNCGLPGVSREGERGLLEECDGATLFLDEIALLPPQAQGALLLPIEGRPFNPAAGKGAPRSADVRFIFASNARLEDEVAAGRFRNDLLRRIRSRGCIDIPPLRERMGDVPILASHFLRLWSEEKKRPMVLGADAEEILKSFEWQRFNVAELATAIKVAADNALFRGAASIEPEHLPPEVLKGGGRSAGADEGGIFDAEELREIGILRRNFFRMAQSEVELGYTRDAKTLSNHLRGITYKVLATTEWGVEKSAALLVGGCVTTRERIRKKIDFYIQNAGQLIGSGGERRIFNNLPQKYHHFAEQLIKHLKES